MLVSDSNASLDTQAVAAGAAAPTPRAGEPSAATKRDDEKSARSTRGYVPPRSKTDNVASPNELTGVGAGVESPAARKWRGMSSPKGSELSGRGVEGERQLPPAMNKSRNAAGSVAPPPPPPPRAKPVAVVDVELAEVPAAGASAEIGVDIRNAPEASGAEGVTGAEEDAAPPPPPADS